MKAFKLVILVFYSGILFSQSPFNYIWPIDSPFVITGNYGELRPNHFHAGIDFSTNGQVNLPIYCIEEGYVSRIRLSPYGYGKCIYITHPNGKVSVYAHLNAFSMKIAALAKEYQYNTQSSEIDFMPKPRSAYVRKNEIIGLSGNTGGSTGPHLHFEIRDELSEIPLNPLGFYRTADRTPPEINALAFYNLSDTSAPKFLNSLKVKQLTRDSFALGEDHVVLGESIAGLAFSGLDRFKAAGNPNNIFSARLYVDDSLVYVHHLNNIAFSDSRFINEFSEVAGRIKYQKCFLPTVYPDGFFGKCLKGGRLLLSDKVFSKIKFIVSDEAGNTSKIQFYLKAKQITGYKKAETKGEDFVNCTSDFTSSKNNLRIYIPAKTLFYSVNLSINNRLEEEGRLTILPGANLRQPVSLGFKVPSRYWRNSNKLLLKGASTSLPVNRNDSVFFTLKDLGNFRLATDTIPPKVTVDYSERKLESAWQMDAFSFHITDHSSGIGKYNLWLNNSWVPVEYDAKTDLLTYYFDDNTPIGLLQFKLEVLDKVGNKTFLEYTLKK